jgi:alpha-L-fucosidase
MRAYVHAQVEELLTQYGAIDLFWFDGVWPRTREDLEAEALVARMRELQPDVLINNRLGGKESGDIGTPEHQIQAEDRLWESCQVSTWRLWGYTVGERWRPADKLLDMLCESASKGGNLLLNVGPQADGQLPPAFVTRARSIGDWLAVHGEAIYGNDGGDVTEFVTRGWQTTKGNALYLIFRFWDGRPTLRLADLITPVTGVELLTTGQSLPFEQKDEELFIHNLPHLPPTSLFPVIKVTCDGPPEANQWGKERLWSGDPQRVADWARRRGDALFVEADT